MALKNIVVADSGAKVALFPRTKDEGERVTLDAKASAAVRKHVEAMADQSPGKYINHAAKLKGNKRVGMFSGNGMVAGIRSIVQDFHARKGVTVQAPADVPVAARPVPVAAFDDGMAQVQAEAEARNAKINEALQTLREMGVL